MPAKWETDRLIITDTLHDDAESLQTIYEESFKEEWVGKENKPTPDLMRTWITEPELPPNGKKELQRLQTIKEKTTADIIGYLDVYHGYPKENHFYIGELFLHSKAKGKQYGREIVKGLIKELKKIGTFTDIRCAVKIRNWAAVRFWARVGFDRIVGYFGDKEYSPNKFAEIVLNLNLEELENNPESEWMTETDSQHHHENIKKEL